MTLAASACGPTPDVPYAFALLGDNPYHSVDVPRFEALIDHVNARADLRWVLHVGDIQGGQGCSDDLLRGRFELFQGFDFPFVYTPGDNDWFDCHREWEGGWDVYERLDFLRSVFFPDPGRTTGGRSMPVESQSAEAEYSQFVENVMWTYGGVVYATVHLVSVSPEGADTAEAVAGRRMDAAVSWITEAFTLARESNSAAVFIATQVDPWGVSGLPALVDRICPTCLESRPYLMPLYAVLREQVTLYDKPVVLAVGDTHIFRVDKPLYRRDGSLIENFTRVETFGDPLVHWVRVTVDLRETQVFSFHQELVPDNERVAHTR